MAIGDLEPGTGALQLFGGGDAVFRSLGDGGADFLDRLGRWAGGWSATLDAEPVLRWNQQALDAIRTESASPLIATRALAMESIAVFVALDVVDNAPLRLTGLDDSEAASAATAAAAHRVLSAAFPSQQAAFDAALTDSLAGVPDGAAENAVVALGRLVGNAVVALRAGDGWNDALAYPGGTAPGEWRPTPPGEQPALSPQWGAVEPFALEDADQFRPAGPPDLAGAAYATALDEVKRLGAAAAPERTADQTETALFWADNAGTYTPPGHWNQIAAGMAGSENLGAGESARLLALLNVALADAGIAAWEAKYAYDFWRPVTAIRLADTDNNAATTADPAWTPLLATPNHPEYVSGHAAFSGAAAAVLAAVFGDVPFTAPSSVALPGVTRGFDGFIEAAAEAGRSRIYGGIHYEFSNVDGLAMGRAVGDWALDAYA